MTQPLAAIRAHRVLPIEPDYPTATPYRPALRIVATQAVTWCSGCDNDAVHIISEACRHAARNMLPLPCESVLADEHGAYRHSGPTLALAAEQADAPPNGSLPADVQNRRHGAVIRDILAYLAQSGPTDSGDISDNLPQHERRIVVNVLPYMVRRGLVYRAKPLVGQRYRTATYSLTPVHYEMTVRTDGMSDRDREIIAMRLAGRTIDGIAETVHLAEETVSNIIRRGITECLIADTES
jgi:DNA-binding CsgD family transcriptional regulator